MIVIYLLTFAIRNTIASGEIEPGGASIAAMAMMRIDIDGDDYWLHFPFPKFHHYHDGRLYYLTPGQDFAAGIEEHITRISACGARLICNIGDFCLPHSSKFSTSRPLHSRRHCLRRIYEGAGDALSGQV